MLRLAPGGRSRVEADIRIRLAEGLDPKAPDGKRGPVGGIGIIGWVSSRRPRLPPQVERVEGVLLSGVVGIELRVARLGGDGRVARRGLTEGGGIPGAMEHDIQLAGRVILPGAGFGDHDLRSLAAEDDIPLRRLGVVGRLHVAIDIPAVGRIGVKLKRRHCRIGIAEFDNVGHPLGAETGIEIRRRGEGAEENVEILEVGLPLGVVGIGDVVLGGLRAGEGAIEIEALAAGDLPVENPIEHSFVAGCRGAIELCRVAAERIGELPRPVEELGGGAAADDRRIPTIGRDPEASLLRHAPEDRLEPRRELRGIDVVGTENVFEFGEIEDVAIGVVRPVSPEPGIAWGTGVEADLVGVVAGLDVEVAAPRPLRLHEAELRENPG